MYQTGHYGVALLVYAPVGAALLLAGFEGVAVAGAVGTVSLSRLPDVDERIPSVEHRGCTHTFAFALLVGAVVGALAFALAPESARPDRLSIGGFGALVGFLSVASHLLADVVTPKGITPFWPVASAHYTLSITRADDPVANFLLLTGGVTVSSAVILLASWL